MSSKQLRIVSRFRSSGKKRIASWLAVTLVAGLFVPIQFAAPANAFTATTSCGTFVGGSNPTFSGLKIVPLHGKAMYVNFRGGVDAAYIGYRIENSSGATLENLWLELTNFTSSISLANPADSIQPIGQIANNSSKNVFILVRATNYSDSASRHDVRIHRGVPSGTSTIYSSGTAQCFYNFEKVVRTLSASANKVDSISVSTTSPVLGSTITVTVAGQTGQGGSGSASPDGAVMWLSGASQSSWPTRAIRLESTSISVRYKKTGGTTSTFSNQLILSNVNTSNTKFTSSTTYTTTYTYRIIGSTATNPVIRPINHISSGTQIKYTGKYPAVQTTLNTSSVAVNITSTKTVTSIGTAEVNPTQTSPSVPSGSFFPVNYSVVLTATPNTTTTIDSIVDDSPTGSFYRESSARVTDLQGSTRIIDPPRITSANSRPQLTFGGPFTTTAGGTITLTYTLWIPVNADANSTITYTNYAYGLIGNKIVGESSTAVPGQTVSTTNGGATSAPTTGSLPKQDQVIDFPAIPTGSVGGSYTLNAIASSGLPVSYVSTTPSVCTVSGDQIIYIGIGTCSITATQGGNTEWNPATDVVRTVVVRPGQVITFAPNSPMSLNGTQDVTATADSGLAVTLTVISVETCSVSGTAPNFRITALASGQCVIVASQAGDDNYGPAQEVERTIFIGTAQYIDFPALSDRTLSGSTKANITATSLITSNNSATILPVLFSSDTPIVCDITKDTSLNKTTGVSTTEVEWTSSGLCIIRASQDGLDELGNLTTYSPAADVVRSFRVGTVPNVVVTTNVATIPSSGTVTATVTVTQASGDTQPTGSVTLYVSGHVVSTSAIQTNNLSSGQFAFQVTARALAASAQSELMVVTATYGGDGNFGQSATTQDVNVTVTPPVVAPAATTSPATNVTTTTATISGIVNANNADATISLVYGNTNTPTTSAGHSPTSTTGTSNTTTSANLTGLTPATLYYYQVAGTNSAGTTSGSVLSFVTIPSAPGNPTIAYGNTNSLIITFDRVTVGASVSIQYTITCTSSDGGATVVSNQSDNTSGGSKAVSITTMTPGKTYTCTVFATSSATNAFGGGAGAVTSASTSLVVPSVTTLPAVNITTSGAVIKGSTLSAGLSTARTLTYGTADNLNGGTAQLIDTVTTNGEFTLTLTGLNSDTTYYFRASSASTEFGSIQHVILSFRTLSTNPYALTDDPTSITSTSFKLLGRAHPRGNSSNSRFEFGTDATLTTKTDISNKSFDNTVNAESQLDEVTRTNLTPATIYYYRAALTVGATNYPANEIKMVLTKPAQPTITGITFSGTTGSVAFTYPANSAGVDVTITYEVVCTSQNPSTTLTVTGSSSPISVPGMSEDVQYTCTVTAIATAQSGSPFGGGRGDSSQGSNVTITVPLIAITDAPISITAASFIKRGRVNTLGNSQGKGQFEFGTTSNLTGSNLSSEQTATANGETTLFDTVLTGLNPGTIYYYRSVAKGQGKSNALGDIRSVLTLAPTPTISSMSSSGTSITVNFTFANPGPNVTLNFTVECTPVGGGNAVTGSGTSSPITVTGLSADTDYSCEVFGSSSSGQANHGGGRGNNSTASNQRTPAANPPGGGGGGNQNNDPNIDPAPINPGGGTGPTVPPTVPTEPTPRRDVSGTTVRTRANTPRTEPVPGLLQNDPTRLPPAAQNITANKANLEINDGDVLVTPLNGWTGRMSVPVIINVDGEDREVMIEVIVEPELPESGKTTLNKDATTLITWEASPSQVVRYEVDLNGRNVCTTTATSCSITRLIGPKSEVKVTAVGNDEVKTTELKLPYTPPSQRVQALTVFFAENKAEITPRARKDLNKIARVLKKEGFSDLKLFGHTDGQNGARNAINLSTQRANIVQNYLLKKLGVEASRVSVAKTPVGEKKPAASNSTKAGQAKNRRTELWLR
jgi:outer membrane protein OmpA-like peptidoglycan-associated protein